MDVYPESGDGFSGEGSKTNWLKDPAFIHDLGTTAAKIAFYNFQWRFFTVIIYNTMVHIGVEAFLATYNQSVYLKYGKWVPRHRAHVSQFVVFGEDTLELSQTVQWLIQAKYDNSARYVMVCADPKKCDENEMFQTLAHFYIVNVIFVKPSDNYTYTMLFTYDPILPGKCRNNKPFQVKLLNCKNDVCFKKLYPEKLGNLHKCPFVISTLQQPPFMYLNKGVNGTLEASGADGGVINVLSEILNGTLYIRTPDDGEWGNFENNNWTGSFGDIFNKRAHASLCAAPLTPQLHANFQVSHTYASLDMVWAARLPSLKPSFEKLLFPLQMHTRIALFGIFLIIVFINTFIKSKLWRDVRKSLNIGRTNASLCFYSWLVFLGLPLVKLPSRGTLRVIVISWVWFCFIIRTAYQAALVSSMKLMLYEDYLENFEDVIKNKYPYGGLGSLRGYYSEDAQVIANWVYVKFSKAQDVLESLLNGTSDFVVALNKEFIIEHLMKYNGTKRVQILPEKIVNSPAVLYLKKFAPFCAPINRVLSGMIEAGIIDMFYSRHLDRGDYLFRHEQSEAVVPLKMSQITSSLAILFTGWFISILYFFIEVLINKLENRNKRCNDNT